MITLAKREVQIGSTSSIPEARRRVCNFSGVISTFASTRMRAAYCFALRQRHKHYKTTTKTEGTYGDYSLSVGLGHFKVF
jgi:hypothetical protein